MLADRRGRPQAPGHSPGGSGASSRCGRPDTASEARSGRMGLDSARAPWGGYDRPPDARPRRITCSASRRARRRPAGPGPSTSRSGCGGNGSFRQHDPESRPARRTVKCRLGKSARDDGGRLNVDVAVMARLVETGVSVGVPSDGGLGDCVGDRFAFRSKARKDGSSAGALDLGAHVGRAPDGAEAGVGCPMAFC